MIRAKQVVKLEDFVSSSTDLKLFLSTVVEKLFGAVGAVGAVNEAIQSYHLHLVHGSKMFSDLRLMLCGYKENFSTFWIEAVQEASGLHIDEPVLPRTRYAPRRIDHRADATHVFTTPEDYYRVLFLAMLDAASISLQEIFESETWHFLSKAESVLLVKGVSTTVLSDFDKSDLKPE